jgi:hypothetical protein
MIRFAGLTIFPGELQTPDGFARCNRKKSKKWWPIIKAANLNKD